MLLLPVLALLGACSPYKFAGDQVMRFGEKEILPHELAGDDLGIGCSAAQAFAAPGMAFERVGTDVNQIAILLLLTSGVCTEFVAAEHELGYLRALYGQNPVAAQDARIAQKRAHALAARRQHEAWLRFLDFHDLPHENRPVRCPKLRSEFDQLVFLVGLLSGLQAVMNDAQSGQVLNVPRDIAPQVANLSTCLDSDKWWDMPLAIRAGIWQIVPMLAPPDVQPMQIIERIAHRGEREGIRLGHVIWALAAWNGGDNSNTKRAMRDFVDAGKRYTQNNEYRILDTIAGDVMLAVSDRIWTEKAGHRTPMMALGTFPDDPPRPATNIDELL